MNVRSLLFFVVCFLLRFTSSAQEIIGQIAPFDATVNYQLALFSSKDSSLIKSTFVDSTGTFEFSPLKPMNYFVVITNDLGFKYVKVNLELSDDQSSIELGNISLVEKVNAMNQIDVVAKKSFIVRKADRIIVNPDALATNTGTSALDLLEKIPGIFVDYQGNISLKGKSGVQVFIDNRPTYLSAEELANMLRSMPSTSIETLELMSNPPAKYDASGNAGIVNITTKKTREKGLNGSLTLSYGQGRYYRTNNSLNINYRLNKFNFFTGISWTQNNMYQDLDINRYYFTNAGVYTSGFEQNSYIKKQNGGRSLKFGCDWYATNKSTFGVVVSGFYNPSTSEVTNHAKILDANNTTSATVYALTKTKTNWFNGSLNTNYNLKLDTLGKEMNFSGDYLNYSSQLEQSLFNQTDSIDGTILSAQNLSSQMPKDIVVKTAKLDFMFPFKKNDKLEFGLKTAFVNTNNIADFNDSINGALVPNYTFSNQFKYKENNNAAYVSYSRGFKKIDVQLGLRMERIQMNGNQLGNPIVADSSFETIYTSLFPTAFVSYAVDSLKNHMLVFSAGRRINYPNYDDMNPFTYPLDAYTLYGGNPFLKPTFSYTIESSYSFKNIFSVGFDYSFVHNLIGETNEQVNGVFYSRPGNFGQQIVYGFNLSTNLQLAKWCTLQFYSESKSIAYNTTIYTEELKESHWYLYLGPNFIFTASKRLNFELSGSYQSRVLVGQFLTIPVSVARFGMSYKILKDQGTVKLALSDIFFSNRPGGDIRNIKNSSANWKSELDTRVVQISFSYRFNKGKALSARKFSASDEEKTRIKTN